MKLSVIATLSSLFFLVACSGGGGTSSKPFASGDKLTANHPMIGVDPTFSEGTGLLVIKKHGSVGVCTSFLVKPDQLMTNSHCLKNISLTESCSQNVVVHLKSSAGVEFKRCKRIISKSKTTGDFLHPDFAVIELDSPYYGATKKLSREGVVEHQELTVESVDYSDWGDGLYGQRKISKCTPVAGGAMGNFTNGKSSIIPVFGDRNSQCKIIPGNSGSPVFNSANEVVSIMFATLDREELNRRIGANARNTALATNLACIRSGLSWFDASRPHGDCNALEREEAQYMSRLEAKFETDSRDKRLKRAERLKSELAKTFEFEMEEKKESRSDENEKYSYSFKPKCMKNPSGWDAGEMLKVRTENGKRRYATAVGNYALDLTLIFDEFLRPDVNLELVQKSHYELIVPDIDTVTPVKVKIARTNERTGLVEMTEHQVPLCRTF